MGNETDVAVFNGRSLDWKSANIELDLDPIIVDARIRTHRALTAVWGDKDFWIVHGPTITFFPHDKYYVTTTRPLNLKDIAKLIKPLDLEIPAFNQYLQPDILVFDRRGNPPSPPVMAAIHFGQATRLMKLYDDAGIRLFLATPSDANDPKWLDRLVNNFTIWMERQ